MSDISIPQEAPTLEAQLSRIPEWVEDLAQAIEQAGGAFLRTSEDIRRFIADAMRDPADGYTERFYTTREVRRRMRLYGKRGR